MSTPAGDPTICIATASRHLSRAEAELRATPNPAALAAIAQAQAALAEALSRLAR